MPDLFPSVPPGSDAALDEVGELLHRVNRQLRRRANEELAPLGVTPAQARALRVLVAHGAPLRMSELAARLRIVRRSATTVVDELAARGLVQRRQEAADRRATAVEVTPTGIALARRMTRRRHDALRELTAGLDRADLDALRSLLGRLDANIQPRSTG